MNSNLWIIICIVILSNLPLIAWVIWDKRRRQLAVNAAATRDTPMRALGLNRKEGAAAGVLASSLSPEVLKKLKEGTLGDQAAAGLHASEPAPANSERVSSPSDEAHAAMLILQELLKTGVDPVQEIARLRMENEALRAEQKRLLEQHAKDQQLIATLRAVSRGALGSLPTTQPPTPTSNE
jgi:hypothetical protein